MERDSVIRAFREKGLLLRPSALDLLAEKDDSEISEIAALLAERGAKKIISDIDIAEAVGTLKVPTLGVEVVRARVDDWSPAAREWGHRYRIDAERDITGRSRCKGEIADFVANIKSRWSRGREIFAARPSVLPIVPIEKLSSTRGTVRVIALIYSKTTTRKGHIALQIEDESAAVTAIALKGSDAARKAAQVVEDEVVALDVRPTSGDIAIVQDIIWPDLPPKQKRLANCDLAVAFLSDIHIGSKFFLDREFERMLQWLNGTGDGRAIAEKVGYLAIAGDIVDGVGCYPKQERELVIKDIYEQYKIFERLLERIPDHIKVFIVPGNHDGVRRAEPQPAIPKDMLSTANVHSIGNPAHIEIEGLHFLIYHGASLDALIPSIPGLSFAKPDIACIELLRRRNLSPIYDKGEIAPEHEDYLFIDEGIDVFHTGHVHKNCYAEYRGVTIINSGTWQAQTEYQVKLGHIPSPCLLPIYNLGSGKIVHVDFGGPEIKIYE